VVSRRGTTNTNARGNNTQRKRRREAMVQNWRADLSVIQVKFNHTGRGEEWIAKSAEDQAAVLERLDTDTSFTLIAVVPACRCWRCGKLLTADTVTIDRWPVPGIDGGKYTANNTRPACATCNPTTGATVRKGISGRQLLLVILDELRG
jgi:hypothetical protein